MLLLCIIIITITIIKSKYLLLFILSPIKKIKINTFLLQFDNINIKEQKYINNTIEQNEYIPIIEINLPFLTTSYIYFKYIIIFVLYLMIPIFLYILYISVCTILKKRENNKLLNIVIIIFFFFIYNIIITHYIIIPFFISFVYSHYYEFLFYEFDIEFQLLLYFIF